MVTATFLIAIAIPIPVNSMAAYAQRGAIP
jgi:hypothetical protein